MKDATVSLDPRSTSTHLPRALLDVIRYLGTVGESERAQRLSELRDALGQPELRVVVFGEFNRGKSTLINALLGRVVLPAKLIPTTGHVTQVVYGRAERVRVRYVDQREETIGLDRLDSFSSLDLSGSAREDVDLLEVSVDHPLLQRKIALIDTPGLNEKEAQTQRARNAIARADLVMLVLDARQLLNLNERDLAVEWIRERLGKPVVLVVNFMNFLDDKERRDVRTRLGTWTQSHLDAVLGRPWFEVNARGALLHALGEGAQPGDDFASLRDALVNCEGKPREEIQRRSRHGQLLAEVREAQLENRDVLERLKRSVAEVERERAERRQELKRRISRFDADAAARRERVGLDARKSLDSHLDSLVGIWFKGESKENLESSAGRWYEKKLSDAVTEIEKNAAESLCALAGDGLSRPAPLTIQEHLTLDARIEVGTLPAVPASDGAVGGGAWIGGALGTALIPVPVVGTVIGAVVGGLLGSIFGSSQPDYVALYSARAREQWASPAQKTTTLLESQFDARVGELKRELTRQLEAIERVTAGHERSRNESEHRKALGEALNRCEALLRSN